MNKTSKKQVAATGHTPGFARKMLFTVLLILISIVLLLLFEGFLELINLGGDLDLVLESEINGTEYCYINKQVARRFFTGHEVHVPDARTAVFRKHKSTGTYRIFCLGGSTTAGFPFQFNATFPSLVQDRLQTLFPRKKIEVINVGISAINSYSVLDFTRELVNYEPDLFLVYMGHNEFYGALGVGSTQQIGLGRNWVLGYMRLQRLRLFHFVKNSLALFSPAPEVHSANATLMSQIVADKSISRDSEAYQTALTYFDKNLEAIIEKAVDVDARIIVSTLVSNLGDQEPFGWQLSAKLTTVQQQRWHQYVEEAITLEKEGQYNAALELLFRAEKIDPNPAILFFYRARCLQGAGNPSTAKAEYEKARDHDLIRFRASSDFNEVIRDVCRRTNTACLEMEPVLAPYCPDQILDRNLFTDHLHPSFAGYFWMAKAFVEEMQRIGCVDRPRRWETARNLSTRDYRRLAGVTDLERMIASYRIEKLTGCWPFQEKIVLMPPKNTEYDSLLHRGVADLFARKFGWKAAHYQIAQYLEQNKRYDEAAAEYEAVIKVMPFNYVPYIELANLKMRLSEYGAAEEALKTGLQYSQGLPYCYAKLGFLYYFTGRNTQSIDKMHQAIEINQQQNWFNNSELSGAYHILALAYGKQGNYELGIRAARSALTAEPESQDAKAVLQQLEMARAGHPEHNLPKEM